MPPPGSEVSQILEVRACRADLEAIRQKVNRIYEEAETETQKQELFEQFTSYLSQRAKELEKQGGKDSPIYARERAIVLTIINQYRLGDGKASQAIPEPKVMDATIEPEPELPQAAPTAVPPANGGSLDELNRLMEMYKAGLLTQEEFKAAKAKFLGM